MRRDSLAGGAEFCVNCTLSAVVERRGGRKVPDYIREDQSLLANYWSSHEDCKKHQHTFLMNDWS